jgi:hypothetical protein
MEVIHKYMKLKIIEGEERNYEGMPRTKMLIK